ncbi:UNKNOWN [Stylonychia lemnae]|uniref:Cyclic nucleotide-binding domain-containing protein n=1 Tax=Stylonychia lemnae TaxID=5949 RepID=A0A078B7I2_STYLE|nr:UNKNOWN [Stylonychia lemnae]|eukprot:CDW89498.1 UNKNOWN [Stylonychia lemnae]
MKLTLKDEFSNKNLLDSNAQQSDSNIQSGPIQAQRKDNSSKRLLSEIPTPATTTHGNDPQLQMIIQILKKNPEFRNDKDLSVLAPMLREIKFFKEREIQDHHLIDLCLELKYEQIESGSFVFKQGDYGDKFYIILKGKVAVLIHNSKGNKKIQKYSGSFRVPKTNFSLFKNKKNLADDNKRNNSQNFSSMLKKQRGSNLSQASQMTGTLNEDFKIEEEPNESVSSQDSFRSHMSNIDKPHQTPLELPSFIGEIELKKPQQKYRGSTVSSHQIKSLFSPYYNEDQQQKEKELEEFMTKNIEISQLQSGSCFGELALIEQKPRMASIRCVQNTHFAVISKVDYIKVLGIIERKKYNEKIQFLRSLPYFNQLTKTSLGKLTYQFTDIKTIKNQVLYREGEPADYVYIVKDGQFEVTRKEKIRENYQENAKQILENPLRSMKVNNTKGLITSKAMKCHKIYLYRLEKGNLIGDEDLIQQSEFYQTSVICTSLTGLVGAMKREDFLRLENQQSAWKQLQINASQKISQIKKNICLKNDVIISLNVAQKAQTEVNTPKMKTRDEKLKELKDQTEQFKKNQLSLIDSLVNINKEQQIRQIQQSNLEQQLQLDQSLASQRPSDSLTTRALKQNWIKEDLKFRAAQQEQISSQISTQLQNSRQQQVRSSYESVRKNKVLFINSNHDSQQQHLQSARGLSTPAFDFSEQINTQSKNMSAITGSNKMLTKFETDSKQNLFTPALKDSRLTTYIQNAQNQVQQIQMNFQQKQFPLKMNNFHQKHYSINEPTRHSDTRLTSLQPISHQQSISQRQSLSPKFNGQRLFANQTLLKQMLAKKQQNILRPQAVSINPQRQKENMCMSLIELNNQPRVANNSLMARRIQNFTANVNIQNKLIRSTQVSKNRYQSDLK